METQAAKLHEFFKSEWIAHLEEHPEMATFVGHPGLNDRWSDHSREAIERRKKHTRTALARLQAIDRAALDAADQLNYDLYRRNLELDLESDRFPGELMPISQMSGAQQDLSRILSIMPAFVEQDYLNILARLEGVPAVIRQTLDLLSEGLTRGVVPPTLTVKDVPRQLQELLLMSPEQSPMLAAFASFPDTVPAKRRASLKKAAASALTRKVYPALKKMHEFVVERYLPGTRRSTAWRELPDGADWYAFRVRYFTSTDKTPDQLHELGLQEVARLRAEMERRIADLKFRKGWDAFSEMLRKDPRFYFTDARALLGEYRDICKRADAELVKLFGKLPRLPYGVKPTPEYAARSAPTAYYQPGSLAGGRPGWYLANTYNLKARPKWEMTALTLHEAVPGHHMQIALAQEMTDLPEFRRYDHHIAFIEGWALYAESLGDEMGMYDDPYQKLGQLNYEMWRACRLVVDTGLHWKRWGRKQAVDFLAANTAKSLHDLTCEVDRYIAMPGQALAYKVGELFIKGLRKRASAALGSRFDLRAFHDALLENAALPLDLLERHIESWIETRQAE
jgi:uncharacterized protein (DUF885 family)